jgi:uncharacterized YigZ family protein
VSRYPVPAATHGVDEQIKRSRFVTTIARVTSVTEAQTFIQSVRQAGADATHHCWAYVIGPPGSTAQVGMSDDGEPHGTAGRPMLNVLLHSGVGDVGAVVTRYYGGTKLGTGGLVRAYSGGVQHALDTMPRAERIEYVCLTVGVEYAKITAFEQLCPSFEAEIDVRHFDVDAAFDVRLPDTREEEFRQAVLDLTRGRARFEAAGLKPCTTVV